MKATFLILLSILYGTKPVNYNASEELQQEVTTYYFIRHGEKNLSNKKNRDPELSEEGRKRAQQWAEVFKKVNFQHIFSTDTKRTLSTAQPTAAAQNLAIEIYDAAQMYDLDFQKRTRGKTVLIVGHSNTNPTFVNRILGEEKYQELEENDYSSLFIVTVMNDSIKTSEVLYIH